MSAAAQKSEPIGAREFSVTRIFAAPRALVWRCFTEPEHMEHWWGPRGSTIVAATMDLRVGGTYHGAMRDPEGRVMWAKFVYRQIVEPQLLVWEHSFSDEAGGLTRHPLSPTWPLKLLTTVTFEDTPDGRTKLTLRWSPLDASEEERSTFDAAQDGMRGGWAGTFDQLAAYLDRVQATRRRGENVMTALAQADPDPREREVTITRVFDAPRELVFAAWTDAKHLAQWWGPRGFTNPVCAFDARIGGALRIVMRGPDGVDYPMQGEIREIVAPERLAYSFVALDEAGNHILEGWTVVTFSEERGKTRMTLQTRATAVVDYARRHLAGMEEGWTQSIDKLEALLQRGLR